MRWVMDSWQMWALLSALFAAITAVFAKLGVSELNSDLAMLIRTAVVLVLVAALLAARGGASTQGLTRESLFFLILSGLATGASWLCYFRALARGQVSQVASVDKLSVVIIAVLGAALLGEQVSLRAWVGVLLIFGGAVLVAMPAPAKLS